jgi:hypothetical protein
MHPIIKVFLIYGFECHYSGKVWLDGKKRTIQNTIIDGHMSLSGYNSHR